MRYPSTPRAGGRHLDGAQVRGRHAAANLDVGIVQRVDSSDKIRSDEQM
jgi:hypothetical protein